MSKTIVKNNDKMELKPVEGQYKLYHKEYVSRAEAEDIGFQITKVLYEEIEPGGAVVPHTHSHGEIICLMEGKVHALINGIWEEHDAGDVFIVPPMVCHSVVNAETDKSSKQISVFLPAQKGSVISEMLTEKVYNPSIYQYIDASESIEALMRGAQAL